MIEVFPSRAAQKLVVIQQNNRLKMKNEQKKRGNSNICRFQCQVVVLFDDIRVFFFQILCQNY